MLDERGKAFKRMLVNTFDDHCNSCLYTPRYHLLDEIVEFVRKYMTPSILDRSKYQPLNVHFKYYYRNTSERR